MCLLPINNIVTAFMVWKHKSKIELTSAQDGQAKLIGLQKITENVKL